MKWLRLPLRWQLLISYLPLLLIPILVIGFVTRGATEQGLSVLITQQAENRARFWSHAFADYYVQYGSWSGVTVPLSGRENFSFFGNSAIIATDVPPPVGRKPPAADPKPKPPPKPEQIILVNTNNVVIASDDRSVIGQTLTADAVSHGAQIFANNQWVGTVVIGTASGALDQQQAQLFDTINAALLLSAVVSVLLTLVFGVWLSGQITAPIKRLMSGVKGLASGQWSQPVPVVAQNEFADLTRAFNEMANEVTHQQQLRQQMVADIAHDLRTPLSVMALEIQAIHEGLQTPADAATSLQEEVTWLQRLVDDLHILSMMDADQVTLQCEGIAPIAFVRSLFNQWLPLAEKENHLLQLEVPPALPIVAIDADRMRQVFGNLLNNAIYHTEPGTQITLSAKCQPDAVILSVADNGAGICAEDLPHIFDRFYRVDRSRNRRKQRNGSGLGLSIARRLVELHGGKLEVSSVPGRGSVFSVILPTDMLAPDIIMSGSTSKVR